MRGIALFVVTSVIGFAGGAARGEVIWTGDDQTGNLSQWSGTETVNADRLQIVSSPTPEGYKYAMQTTVNVGDIVSNGNRSEVEYTGDSPEEGDVRYYHWKTFFPADYQTFDKWQIFTQWHQYVAGGSPPLAMLVWGDNIQLGNNVPHYYWTAPLVRGVWHDFVVHVTWSTNAAVGGVELWYDGQHVLPFANGQTLFPNDTVFLKQGLYRSQEATWTQTLYHTGMTIGTTLQDVVDTKLSDGSSTPSPIAAEAMPTPEPGQPTGGNTSGAAGSTATNSETPAGPGDPTPKGGCSSAGEPLALAAGAAMIWSMRRRRRWARCPASP